jgi:hypothetical protein
VFHFWELYEGNAAMGRHNTTPEVAAFMEKVQPLLEGPVGMALYEWKDGKIGATAVQGGPRGEGGLDDATGATGAAGGASYKQTSATVDLSEQRISDLCGGAAVRVACTLGVIAGRAMGGWGGSVPRPGSRGLRCCARPMLIPPPAPLPLPAANVNDEEEEGRGLWGIKIKLPWNKD